MAILGPNPSLEFLFFWVEKPKFRILVYLKALALTFECASKRFLSVGLGFRTCRPENQYKNHHSLIVNLTQWAFFLQN